MDACTVPGARCTVRPKDDKEGNGAVKLYNSVGPNPRMVRMFAKEKGIELPMVEVDLRGGENRREPYTGKNPAGQCPALELDDGSCITEITAICEYLDDTHANTPSLIGSTPKERAETHMWTRRIDLNICEPMANGFRFAEGLKMFQSRIRCIPQAADELKITARERLAWLDGLMQGKAFVAGDRLTMADILLFAFLDFGKMIGQPLDPANANLTAWFERMKARPSAAA
jgi:glutathione S-transferase